MNRKTNPLALIIKTIVGISFLILSLMGINWIQLRTSIKAIRFFWFFAVLLAVLIGLFLKILRSYLFIHNFDGRVSFGRVTQAFFLGQAINILLPSRGGDLLRIGYLSAEQPSVVAQVTAAIGVEKYLDLLAMTTVALGVAAYLPADRVSWVRQWLLPLSALASLILLAMLIFGPWIWKRLHPFLARWDNSWFQKGIGLVDRLVRSSVWLRDLPLLIPALLLTAVIWAVMWATNLLLFRGLGLQVPLAAGGLVLVLVYIGVLPALMPGNIGPFYFFAQQGVIPFGAPAEKALAFAILLHAVVTVTPLLASAASLLLSKNVRAVLSKTLKPS
ncbi:MAG: lysylphosphatidylglycerol synthase transmembrane domain-containing protein [Chloroflexota bacterium]|nr:lysylphosphatidylglycerol synthase transmembrane domain-containing protein [Chloroflexota bacterium]